MKVELCRAFVDRLGHEGSRAHKVRGDCRVANRVGEQVGAQTGSAGALGYGKPAKQDYRHRPRGRYARAIPLTACG